MALFTPSIPGLKWNNRAGRYVGDNGRFLSPAKIREAMDKEREAIEAEMAREFERLQGGELTLDQWKEAHAWLIKRLHINAYASAKGGYHKLTQSDLGKIGNIVKAQYKYLNRFAALLSINQELIGTPAAKRRAVSYALAATATHEAVRKVEEKKRGATWCRRILHSAEPCKPCAAIAGKWMRLEDMPPIGSLICNIHCRCTIEYAYTEDKPGGNIAPAIPPHPPGSSKSPPAIPLAYQERLGIAA